VTSSLILRTSARFLLVTCALLSIYILLRGHNEPGGGFIGGLIGALGVIVFALAHGRAQALRLLRLDPKAMLGVGLLLALASGVLPPLLGLSPLLTHQWGTLALGPVALPLGTTLLFDIGVYLTVTGFALAVVLPFAEE
jgi:multicomponent Na+:H+ antiporter subunit B